LAILSKLGTIRDRLERITVFKTSPSFASTFALARREREQQAATLRAAPLFLTSALLLALAALALAADMPLARFLADLDVPYEMRHVVRLGEAFGWGGSVALLIVAAVVLDRRGWRVIPRLAVVSFGSGLLADVIKLCVGRQRPFMTDLDTPVSQTFLGCRLNLTSDDGVQSFPSAHAATAAGLAIALAVLYPRGRWLFAALAMLAAFQRLEVEAHYLSDVLAGASLGCLVGALCQLDCGLGRWFCKLERR
jgi:membrane-associated phospholipid phosphatase